MEGEFWGIKNQRPNLSGVVMSRGGDVGSEGDGEDRRCPSFLEPIPDLHLLSGAGSGERLGRDLLAGHLLFKLDTQAGQLGKRRVGDDHRLVLHDDLDESEFGVSVGDGAKLLRIDPVQEHRKADCRGKQNDDAGEQSNMLHS